MKKELAKYFNRTYGFISGVVVTVSMIILGVVGFVIWTAGIATGEKIKHTTQKEGEDSMET